MATELIDLQLKIEALRKQEAELKQKDFPKALDQIRALMKAYGITVANISRSRKTKGSTKSKAAKAGMRKKIETTAGVKVEPKYRGPEGQLWTGRGMTPRWLQSLIAASNLKDQYLIASKSA